MKVSNLTPLLQIATPKNTVLATSREIIAFLENNYQEDGSIKIPIALQPYIGGLEVITSEKINLYIYVNNKKNND